MNISKENINLLLYILVAVLLTLQIRSCFTKTPDNAELAVAKEKIRSIEEKRIADSLANVEYLKLKDENISLLKQKENVIVNQYIQSNDKIKNIPASVNSRPDDSVWSALRRHLSNDQ